MTRLSKQARKRNVSPRRPRLPSPKTGPKRDQLEFGYKPHSNAVSAEQAVGRFIPKIG